jgi:hypothetical protein
MGAYAKPSKCLQRKNALDAVQENIALLRGIEGKKSNLIENGRGRQL